MLGLKKHCPVCGIDVEKGNGIKRFGKYFCSEQYARQYSERKMINEEEEGGGRGGGGGCC